MNSHPPAVDFYFSFCNKLPGINGGIHVWALGRKSKSWENALIGQWSISIRIGASGWKIIATRNRLNGIVSLSPLGARIELRLSMILIAERQQMSINHCNKILLIAVRQKKITIIAMIRL